MAFHMALPAALLVPVSPAFAATPAGPAVDTDPLPRTRPVAPVAVAALQFDQGKPESFTVTPGSLPSVQVGKSIATQQAEEEEAKRQAAYKLQQEEQAKKSAAAKVRSKQALTTAAAITVDKGSVQDLVRQATTEAFGESQVAAMFAIVSRESGFNPNSYNARSGACGIFQFVPGRLCGAGAQPQIEAGVRYVKARYGTPDRAWAFWQGHGWY